MYGAMKKNILLWERVLRFLVGVLMIAWAVAGGPTWAYLGVYSLASGSWGFCGIYSLLNYQPFEED